MATQPKKPVRTAQTETGSVPSGGDETAAMFASDARVAPSFGPPAEPGEVGQLGPYRIVRELGHGGMGAVYAAIDTRLDRRLALKVMLPRYAADLAAKARFLREARAAARVKHDNVVTVYEADERDGVPYIAMEFLEGYPLDEYLRKRGPPSIPQVVRITAEAASGLAAAHKLGLVHRDIKPGNLWLEAPQGRVKVLDFGLARPVDAEVELTKSGAVVGTPAYMSPEQAQGEKVDARTDLFSLGVVLYRLCTGKLPFDGPSTIAVLMALGTQDPRPVREVNSLVPEKLAELIHQLLAKKVDDRPGTAAEVVRRLRAIAQEPAGTRVRPADGSSPQPSVAPSVVGDVPIQVTAPSPGANPFAAFNADATEKEPLSAVAKSAVAKPALAAPAMPAAPKPARKKSGGKMPWMFAGAAALLVAVVAAVIIIIRNKDGSETKIVVPEGATVTIKEMDGKTLAKVGPDIKPPGPDVKPPGLDIKSPAPPSDLDREAAEYVISLGGIARVAGDPRDFKVTSDLPKGRLKLSGIVLHGTKITDAGLAYFKDCKGVEFIHLSSTAVTDTGLANFKDRKDVWFLDLAETAVRDTGLAHFQGFKRLGHLNLRGTYVTDAGLANFKDSKGIGYLNLSNTAVTNAGLVHFQGCKDLGSLDLLGTAVTDDGLAHLKGCTGLTALVANGLKLTGAGLESFKDCKDLRFLNLGGTEVTDAGLAHLKACRAIFIFNVAGTAVTDAGLASFKDCKDVGHLQLDGTAATDVGLAYFKDCKGMGYLGLAGTKVTDAGLTHFHDCKGLAYLNLTGTQVTAKGLAAFHAAVPGCKIDHDGGVIEPKK